MPTHMKCFTFTHSGFQDVCARELKEILGILVSPEENGVFFETGAENLCRFFYLCQSAIKHVLAPMCAPVKEKKDLAELALHYPLEQWLPNKKTFRISAVGNQEISSQEAMETVGAVFAKRMQCTVDLERPDVTFFVFLSPEKVYLGLDPFSFDMSKRSYKVFHAASSIKGTLAYDFLRWSGYTGKEVLLDPSIGTGTLVIEAALFASKKSPHFFKKEMFRMSSFAPFAEVAEEETYEACDASIIPVPHPIYGFDSLLSHVKSTQKNAKIAGVDKSITSTKCDIAWIDGKLRNKEVDILATQPPIFRTNEAENSFFRDLCHQADYVLQKKGILAILCSSQPSFIMENFIMKNANFVLQEQRFAFSGKKAWHALKFQKV